MLKFKPILGLILFINMVMVLSVAGNEVDFVATGDEEYDKKRRNLIRIHGQAQQAQEKKIESLAGDPIVEGAIENVPVHPNLRDHTQVLPRDFSEIKNLAGEGSGIWVSQGKSIANSILVKGLDNKYIIIDTTESGESAQDVKIDFDAVVGAESVVEGIIVTHFHKDHVSGTDVFDPEKKAVVYGTLATHKMMDSHGNPAENLIMARSLSAYQGFCRKENRVNAGLGHILEVDENSTFHARLPDETFEGEKEYTIAGLNVVLSQAPGETPDQLYAYIKEKNALFPGDNFYETFPNLYTLRGTPYRDPLCWIETLDRLIDLVQRNKVEILVPSHTRPIIGYENIMNALQNYYDGIKFTYDQTVRLMHHGLGPDEIALKLKLPKVLADSPYLQQNYGTTEDAARMIYNGLVGWFDTNPTNLFPLDEELLACKLHEEGTPREKADRYYLEALHTNHRELLTVASWFCDQGLTFIGSRIKTSSQDSSSSSEDLYQQLNEMKRLKIQINAALAGHCTSAMGYSFCVTTNPILTGEFDPVKTLKGLVTKEELHKNYTLQRTMDSFTRQLDPRKTVNGMVSFVFDTVQEEGGNYSLEVRNAVATVRESQSLQPQFTVRGNRQIWKEVSVGLTELEDAVQCGQLSVEGDIGAFKLFLDQFDKPLKKTA